MIDDKNGYGEQKTLLVKAKAQITVVSQCDMILTVSELNMFGVI